MARPGWQFGKDRCQQGFAAERSVPVAGAQFAVPEIFALGVEAQQRMVGSPPGFDGVVSDRAALLVSVQDQDGRIQVEGPSGGRRRFADHAGQQLIVQSAQPWGETRRLSDQEATQGGRIGIRGQSRQILEHAVVLEQMRGFDPLDAQHHGIEQGEQLFGDAVASGAADQTQFAQDASLEIQATQKAVQQVHACKPCEVWGAKRNAQIFGSRTHRPATYLLGRLLSKRAKLDSTSRRWVSVGILVDHPHVYR